MKEEFKFAVVQSADANGVMVQFEDDQTPSPKKYTRLQSCVCVAGERVLMAPASGQLCCDWGGGSKENDYGRFCGQSGHRNYSCDGD